MWTEAEVWIRNGNNMKALLQIQPICEIRSSTKAGCLIGTNQVPEVWTDASHCSHARCGCDVRATRCRGDNEMLSTFNYTLSSARAAVFYCFLFWDSAPDGPTLMLLLLNIFHLVLALPSKENDFAWVAGAVFVLAFVLLNLQSFSSWFRSLGALTSFMCHMVVTTIRQTCPAALSVTLQLFCLLRTNAPDDTTSPCL